MEAQLHLTCMRCRQVYIENGRNYFYVQHRATRQVFRMGMGTIEMTQLRVLSAALTALFWLGTSGSGAFAGMNLASQKYETAAGKEQKPRKAKASGLAGSEGNVRRKVLYTSETGGGDGCSRLYRQYVAASGHSAFASTPVDYFYGSSVCASSLNAPSTKAAEERAMASCRAGAKKYKSAGEIGVSGACEIFMSK